MLNGCEWRRKTGGANFDPVKFKSLIMDGCVSVRIKKKKSLLIIRTPHCACLLKFFPCIFIFIYVFKGDGLCKAITS